MAEMDVVLSLKKIAKELREGTDPEAAAFLIDWIAEGIQRELNLGAQRARQLTQRQLPPASPFAGMPLCVHGIQFDCEQCKTA